ncbi:hypothetical protein DXG01_010842 [Tephrocybe rancida]|nr:hypothetical protein DXG01_010842 [Tephrocybe rancida]
MGWPRLWCLERLPNVGHLEAAGPQVPIDDLFAVWQRTTAGVLPGGPRIPSSSSVSKRKRASLTASPPPSLPTEGNTGKGKQCQVIPEDDADDGRVVGKMGTHHRCRAKKQQVVSPPPSPSPSPLVPQIRPGTPLQPPPPTPLVPLFLPSLQESMPVAVPWSPLPAPSFPLPVHVPVSTVVPPTNHPLIDLDSDVERCPCSRPPLHTFSILQLQRIHPQRPPYFVEPSEDGEVVDGLEEGISAMSPPEILGMIQQELNSLTPKQLRNLLLRVKGQHQTKFEHINEMAKGWREAISYTQGLAIGKHQWGLHKICPFVIVSGVH